MPYSWFTTYSGYNWTPERGYNTLFAEQVRLIREWFHLTKTQTVGREVGTGKWRKYDLQGETVFIAVDTFQWKGYREAGGTLSPVFKLEIRIGQKKPKGLLAQILNDDSQERIAVFFHNTLIIEFPRFYPDEPPRFRIDDHRYDREASSHSHHMFRGGWFCILANPSDWNRGRDTIISGLNAALDWIVWHHRKFGW